MGNIGINLNLKPNRHVDRERAIKEILRKFEKNKFNEKRSRILLKTLISLGADFGKISLKDAQILNVDYTGATGLTLDNWLSAAKQMFTILPEMDLSNWTPPDNFRGFNGAGWTSSDTPYYRTRFHNVHGLSLDKMLMFGAPETLPITIEYTRGCFLNKRIRKWNFGYNTNIPLEEILQVNKAFSVYMPYNCDMRNLSLSDISEKLYNCIFEDPILPKDTNVLNSLCLGRIPNGDITDNEIWYSGVDKLLQNDTETLSYIFENMNDKGFRAFLFALDSADNPERGFENKVIYSRASFLYGREAITRKITEDLNAGKLADETEEKAKRFLMLRI